MCSIFQLHEQQMHLKKIDIVHPASKVFAVGDKGHNLSELRKLFVSLKVSLQELLTGAPLELFPLKSANGSELGLQFFNICQFILGFQI